MEKGWIKSYRKIMDNRFLMHDNNAFMVFVKLLHIANRETGEYASGRHQLGELMNINARTLYDVLIRLENQQMINISSNNKYSVISICNWSEYQDSPTTEPTSTQQPANNQPTTRQHSNKNKEVRKKNTIDVELLKLLNEKTSRTFRTLPNGYKKTLELFSLEEIGQALDNMKQSQWHAERWSELKSDYLLRSSTIDDMLNRKSNASSQQDWFSKIKEASGGSN